VKKRSLNPLRYEGVQTLLASLVCIVLGVLVGYIVLLIIEPSGANDAIKAILRSFLRFEGKARAKYFGQTLVRSVPILMCALSVLFSYKVGMFNIGVAGQYVAGACGCLYAGLAWDLPWYLCLLVGMAAGALLGAISGFLKTKCNVNVVISGIMLNWITLYLTNMILTTVKSPNLPDTKDLRGVNPDALLPSLGLEKLFNNEKTVTIAIPLAVIMAVVVWVILSKTKFGYELRATGHNYHAAKYAGMKESRNIIFAMMISGALAAMGAGLYYLTGIKPWVTTESSVPGIGFSGIAVAFLGGLSPFGSILAAFFIQFITDGGGFVDTNYYCVQISELIASLIIYLCAFMGFLKFILQAYFRKRDEKKLASQKAENTEEGGEET